MRFSRSLSLVVVILLSILFYTFEKHIDKYSDNLSVLMYHSVSPTGPIDRTELGVVIKPTDFENQLKYLKDHGYNFIGQNDVINNLKRKDTKKPIWVTFDDGYNDNYLYAYPILKKYDIPATINVVVSKISDKEGRRYVSWNSIRLMEKDNILVGSHSYNSHRYEKGVNNKEEPVLCEPIMLKNNQKETYKQFGQRVYNDFSIATRAIEKYAGYRTYVIAYPYGKANKIAKQIAYEMGYKIQLGIEQGINKSIRDLENMKRITARGNDSAQELEFKIRFYNGLDKIPF